jgi:hypothetical protein
VVEISDTIGLWERSLIAWPDGSRDTTTYAGWLQGPALFADLRQPADPPSFAGVTCLNELDAQHFDWLARQEGFAGRLVRAGEAFEWQRHIDFQCPTSASDAGFLEFRDGVLVEVGRDVPYIEHWHPALDNATPQYAMRLEDDAGRKGYLVRAGTLFMFVRGRATPLPHGERLPDLVASADAQTARALLDCEISLGRVGQEWIIKRSSLPYRVGADLAPYLSADGSQVTTAEIDDNGAQLERFWRVIENDTAIEEDDTHRGNAPGHPRTAAKITGRAP